MNILTQDYEIRSALANMSSEAQRAALMFAAFLGGCENLTQEKLLEGLGQSVMSSLHHSGWDLSERWRIEEFCKDNLQQIVIVGISLAQQKAPEKKFNWKKAGAVAAGVVASFFLPF